nr:hypothetical protein [Pandoravirus aubagnensis]
MPPSWISFFFFSAAIAQRKFNLYHHSLLFFWLQTQESLPKQTPLVVSSSFFAVLLDFYGFSLGFCWFSLALVVVGPFWQEATKEKERALHRLGPSTKGKKVGSLDRTDKIQRTPKKSISCRCFSFLPFFFCPALSRPKKKREDPQSHTEKEEHSARDAEQKKESRDVPVTFFLSLFFEASEKKRHDTYSKRR